jgi:hypothetical protein
MTNNIISRCKTDTNGNKYWCNDNGELHRTDGPAIERKDGQLEWWVNGELHRTDGPAMELRDGSKMWWVNGELHRTDGPAVEWSDGDKSWWIDGVEYTEKEFNEIAEYGQFKQELGELFKI